MPPPPSSTKPPADGGFPPPPPAPPGPRPSGRGPGRWLLGGLLALVMVAAIAVSLVVTGQDDDPTASGGAGDDTAGQTTPTPEPSPTPTEPAPVPPADALVGAGYFYELPGIGWTDISDARQLADAPTVDTMSALGTTFRNASANILVEAFTSGGITEPEDLESQWKRNIVGGTDVTPRDLPDRDIDGERAIGIAIERDNDAGVSVRQRAYLVLHDGNQFSIALSYPAGTDDIALADFEKALDSWRWTR